MMPNDSTAAGYITPTSTAPAADLDLDKILQHIVVGLTGLAGNMVRPRWQPTTPKQPEPSANWAAVGVTNVQSDSSPAIIHDPTSDGSDTLIRHERVECLVTFYGPNGQQYAEMFRDGFWLSQNSAMLDEYDMSFVDAGPIRSVPEYVNQQARRRYDLAFTLRRKITRSYGVRNILSADVELIIDTPPTDVIIHVDTE
jgi:hypothetical protein